MIEYIFPYFQAKHQSLLHMGFQGFDCWLDWPEKWDKKLTMRRAREKRTKKMMDTRIIKGIVNRDEEWRWGSMNRRKNETRTRVVMGENIRRRNGLNEKDW